MPKKKKTEQPAPIFSINATVGGQNTLVGQIISLNPKQNAFWGIGDIDLSEKNFWAEVSPDMPEDYYMTIQRGLDAGKIVRGKRLIPAVDRNPATLDQWYRVVDMEGKDTPRLRDAFKQLVQKRKDNNYSLGEIVRHCLAQERRGKSREEVIDFLKKVYAYVDSRDRSIEYDDEIYEEEEGKVEVTLVQTPDGIKIKGQPGEAPEPQEKKPELGHTASQVLDKAFGLD